MFGKNFFKILTPFLFLVALGAQAVEAPLAQGPECRISQLQENLHLTPSKARLRVEALHNRPIPESVRKDLEARWALLDRERDEMSWDDFRSIDRRDPRYAAIKKAKKEILQNRLGLSNTVSGKRGVTKSGFARRNFNLADEQIQKWVDAGVPLTPTRLKKINALINRDIKSSAGRFRTQEVKAGTKSRYIPPPIDRALERFFDWYYKNESVLYPIEFAAKAYERLVSIHPFPDGNGRTTRLVMDWILENSGFPPATYAKKGEGMPAIFAYLTDDKNQAPEYSLVDTTSAIERTYRKMNDALRLTPPPETEEIRDLLVSENHIRQTPDGRFEVLVPNALGNFKIVSVDTQKEADDLAKTIDYPLDLEAFIKNSQTAYDRVAKKLSAQGENGARFYGRVKELPSLQEKVFRWGKSSGSNLRDRAISDMIGTRFVVDSKEIGARIIDRVLHTPGLKIDYVRDIRLGDGYRGVHIGLHTSDLQMVEVQILSKRMEDWSKWQHDRSYKPTPGSDPQYIMRLRAYGRQVAAYLNALDDGAKELPEKPDPQKFGIHPEDIFQNDDLHAQMDFKKGRLFRTALSPDWVLQKHLQPVFARQMPG